MKTINDELYTCDHGNHRIQVLNTELEYMDSFGCHGNGDGQFNDPNGICFYGYISLLLLAVFNYTV